MVALQRGQSAAEGSTRDWRSPDFSRILAAMTNTATGAVLCAMAMAVLGAGFGLGCATGRSAGHAAPQTTQESAREGIPQRHGHATALVAKGPSPQAAEPWTSAGGLRLVEYVSNGLHLKGYLLLPPTATLRTAAGYPVLVYLHGGFALGADDVTACRPFSDAGFAVFAPAWRGENGNPGYYELAYGELDDARAALAAIPSLGQLDVRRVVVFGHSAGGMLSSLLALYPELPVLDTGSAGGFYSDEIFGSLPIPFDDNTNERRLRLAYYHAAAFNQPHFACAGEQDEWPLAVAKSAAAAAPRALISVDSVPGDHQSSLALCMGAYLERVLKKLR